MTRLTRRALLAAPLLTLPSPGRTQDGPVRIGVLNDQSSVYSDGNGAGSVLSAHLAAEEFTASTGMGVEILIADHQNKADVGLAIARDWFDRHGVHAVADVGNSAVALAVANLAREKDRACLISSGGTTLLTGAQCSPNTVHWTYDTYGTATALAQALVATGKESWFFIAADYTFGQSLEDSATEALKRLGGTVVGSVRHPLNTADFSSYLLQAQASGAKVVALANGGDDTDRCVKQAHEFGLTVSQALVGLAMVIVNLQSIGLDAAQNMLVSETFYWDLNDGTRAFSRRWSERNRGREPTMMQAGVYGVVLHYLKAVHELRSAASGAMVVRQMKAMPTDDLAFGPGAIRADGRALHNNYVFRVKTPEESRHPWDWYTLVSTVTGDRAFRPVSDGGCPLLAQMERG